MKEPPRWVPWLFGAASILMGALILGAFFGVVPTDGGHFTSPPAVILGLGTGLLLFGGMLWVPRTAPAFIRSGMFLMMIAMVAIVCNWTAFAPEVIYDSSVSLGPISFAGQDQVGGRIVFGIAAIVVDGVLVVTVAGRIASLLKGPRPRP